MASLESASRESRAASSYTASTSQSTKSKKQETKKRRVLTLEEKYKLVKAIKNGGKHTVVTTLLVPLKEDCTKTNERR